MLPQFRGAPGNSTLQSIPLNEKAYVTRTANKFDYIGLEQMAVQNLRRSQKNPAYDSSVSSSTSSLRNQGNEQTSS